MTPSLKQCVRESECLCRFYEKMDLKIIQLLLESNSIQRLLFQAGLLLLPPPVCVVEVIGVKHHAERVVQVAVNHASVRPIRRDTLQTLCPFFF